MIPFLVYKWRRRKNFSEYDFPFEEQTNFKPIHYSYSQIKKMTNNFKEKLGIGSYGNVFKGKLRSGLPIAVKMMNKSMSDAQEFENLVSAIGKIRHGNLLQLVGFCFEGEKRALVYDFMCNGSLRESPSLSYEKMFEISLEIAHGIDHLHGNCEEKSLHFGIKPHNVLIDENLSPKISDFGMVRLYPEVNYMAPEFYYKKIGKISYKADVYSYGILLMEMIGKTKDVEEIKGIENTKGSAEEMKMLKKMIIIALWCIQMLPQDRPSMNKVIEMLGSDLELLKMPSNFKAVCCTKGIRN